MVRLAQENAATGENRGDRPTLISPRAWTLSYRLEGAYPAPMSRWLTGGLVGRQAREILACLAILAILQPSASIAFPGFSFAAWSPSHRHFTLSGAVPPHTHPFEQTTRAASTKDTVERGEQRIAFLPDDDGLGATLVPVVAAPLAVVTSGWGLVELGTPFSVLLELTGPPSPPPRS